MIPKEFIDTLHKPFGVSKGFQGSGTLLAFKMLLSALDGFALVTSNMHIAKSEISVPALVAENVPAASRGLATSMRVVAFAGDMATLRHLDVLSGEQDVLYVCANNHGSESSGFRDMHMIAPRVHANYAATASVAYPEDFVSKLRKAFAMPGFKFVEVFAPSPYLWGFEPSTTVEVARMATECAVWPVYENDGALTLTRRPLRPEPAERYLKMVAPFASERVQEEVSHRWKLLAEGKLA